MLQIETGGDALKILPEICRLMTARGGRAETFEDPGLLADIGQAFPSDEPVLVIYHDRSGPAAMLALRISRKFGIRIASAWNAPIAQYTTSSEAKSAHVAWNALLDQVRDKLDVDVLLLRKMSAASRLGQALDQAAWSVPVDRTAAPGINLTSYRDFAAYLASFSKRTRRGWRQRSQKLEAEWGTISFTVVPGAEARDIVRKAVSWKKAWLKERALSSPVFDGAGCEAAFLAFVERTPDAFVSALNVAGETVAVEVGFRNGDNYISYLGAFDPAFGGYAVGQLQMLRTIEWAFAQGFAGYDLLAPDSDYKRHWTRDAKPVEVVDYAVPLSAVGHVYTAARRRLRPLARSTVLGLPAPVRAAAQGPAAPVAAASLTAAWALLALAE